MTFNKRNVILSIVVLLIVVSVSFFIGRATVEASPSENCVEALKAGERVSKAQARGAEMIAGALTEAQDGNWAAASFALDQSADLRQDTRPSIETYQDTSKACRAGR